MILGIAISLNYPVLQLQLFHYLENMNMNVIYCATHLGTLRN